jgi:hypothetical protein
MRTVIAFANTFAYTQPYCTKHFIFDMNKHDHKQQSADLNCPKIWARVSIDIDTETNTDNKKYKITNTKLSFEQKHKHGPIQTRPVISRFQDFRRKSC